MTVAQTLATKQNIDSEKNFALVTLDIPELVLQLLISLKDPTSEMSPELLVKMIVFLQDKMIYNNLASILI